MQTVTPSPEDISAAALRVFSPADFWEMSEQQRHSFLGMVGRRLEEEGPPPTQAELQGFKLMVTQDLWHPALSRLSEPPQ